MKTTKKLRILVVESNPTTHSEFKRLFSHFVSNGSGLEDDKIALFGTKSIANVFADISIDYVEPGKEAINKIKRAVSNGKPYSLTFVDINATPVRENLTVIKSILKSDPAIEIIICADNFDNSWEELIYETKQSDRILLLKKPLYTVEVQQLVTTLYKKWELGQSIQNQLDGLQDLIKARTSELQYSLSIFKATLESTADAILVVDKEGKIVDYNKKFLELWRIAPSTLESTSYEALSKVIAAKLINSEEYFNKMQEFSRNPAIELLDNLNLKDDRIVERFSKPQRLGEKIIGRVFSYREITERKHLEDQLLRQATHDALTGLPNRKLLLDRLHQAIAYSKRTGLFFSVLFIDIDNFKDINDKYGHVSGDVILQDIAVRVESTVRDSDTIVRLGGDEFVVILMALRKEEDSIPIVQKLLRKITQPYHTEGQEIKITASIGISIYPTNGTDADNLIKFADSAMYRAKELGRNNFQFYAEELNIHLQKVTEMEKTLSTTLDQGGFVLHYLPVIDMQSGEITGVEALIRWQHPKFGLLPPLKFMPLAEDTGVALPISDWVLKAACLQNRHWREQGLPPIVVSINLSNQQFRQPNLVENIKMVLSDTDLDPKYLELEITESMIMEYGERALKVMQALSKLGVNIVIDDFGTGYSSLNYLQRFLVKKIKIDRSFINFMGLNVDDVTVVLAILTMAKSFNFSVVAEGVETEDQFRFLRRHGCNEMQGFFFSPPLSADEFAVMLQNRKKLIISDDK